MKCTHAWLAVLLVAAGCDAKPAAPSSAGAQHEPAAAAPAAPVPVEPAPGAPIESTPNAERQFGAAPKLPGDPVSIAALLAAPEPHVGKVVKCEGKVARVCQAAGCWLELQAESGGEGLRVPMAAHAFFIPQDAVGHVAVVEGELKRRELPDAQKAHYAGEGMKAMGPLALEATSVVLR